MPLTLRLVLIALCAFAGHQRAGWFGRRYGRPPWGLPPVLWGVFTGISLGIGVVLFAIAERQGRSAATHPGTVPPGSGGPSGAAAAGAARMFGTLPANPTFGAPPQHGVGSRAPQFGAPAPQFGTAPPTFDRPAGVHPARRRPTLNAWQDDPSGGFFGRSG